MASGAHDAQFVVDIFQTGSGTSTNMNANEVIGHLAKAHPNDHVNRGQSSNDVIPTAIHLSAALMVTEELLPAMRELNRTLAAKAVEFHDVIKIGRTHLQDAVPMRLGQECRAMPGKWNWPRNAWKRRSRGCTNCRWAERRSAPA